VASSFSAYTSPSAFTSSTGSFNEASADSANFST
jgi:hypothetical protein